MIIDSHNHLGCRGDLVMDDTELLKRMDRAGIDMAVCFPLPVSWNNEYVLDMAKTHSDRIIPFVGFNPWLPNVRDDLIRCLDQGGLGLKLHPVRDSYSLAEKRLVDPLFEVCAERKVPVLCHGLHEWSNGAWQFNEMARRFSSVTLIYAHGGHNWLREDAIEVVKRNTNLYVESSLMYSQYVRRYVEEISPERVLMGTDTPTEVFEVR